MSDGYDGHGAMNDEARRSVAEPVEQGRRSLIALAAKAATVGIIWKPPQVNAVRLNDDHFAATFSGAEAEPLDYPGPFENPPDPPRSFGGFGANPQPE